jgi:nucleoside-diphosphate-sugar epimerase
MTALNIAVVGCGYIGSAAALHWTKQGHKVLGTTRNPDRLKEIAHCAQEGFLIQGDDKKEFATIISDNDVILVSVGADRPDEYDNAYLRIAQIFREIALEMKLPRRLIYTSSTSVYGDAQGQWVDEESELLPDSVQGKILAQTEQVYQSLEELGWQVCILRLAEIYGPHREITKRLKNLPNALPGSGSQYTNMVHKTDCVLAIDYALQHKLEGIFNLTDNDHPTRKELYESVAQKFHLPQPHWDPTRTSLHKGNKRVSNHKIKSAGFAFHFSHRVLS